MDLPRPSPQYDAENEAQTRNAITSADRENIKKKVPQTSFIMVSDDGTKFVITVSNAGSLIVTHLL